MADPTIRHVRGRALSRARAERFARAPWCTACEMDGRQTRATIRHHVIPLDDGGADDVTNTTGLCLDCWDAAKDVEARRGLRSRGVRHAFRKASAPRDAAGHFSERRATREQQQPDQPPMKPKKR